ncbi:hypothetical protein PTKIN_Ptkin14bG0196600 [Pterospermum kingtungense]
MAEAFFVSAASNAVGTLMAEVVQKPLERYLPHLFCNKGGQSNPLRDLEFSKYNDLVASRSYTSALDKIMVALKDDSVNTIGVWGMGGVGKTTLVTDVGHIAKALQLFHKVIKVVVSQTPDIEKIQDKVADFLDLKFEKKTKEGKAEELWLQLEKEEKVLIVLDDMWKELNLKKVGIPLVGNGKGCKIILTTRRKNVCEYMASEVMVSLDVLEEDEAWALFKKKSALDEDKDDGDTIKLAKEVARECRGLPIAIVTLASALKSTKTVMGWEVALKKLKSCRLMEIRNVEEEADENAYMCLKISYDYLRTKTTKRCFLLCSLYPEDHLIDLEELVRFAWGLGLYPNATSIKDARLELFEDVIFQLKKVENQAQLLSNLKFLRLQELPNLECIWKVPTQHVSLGSLEVVRLRRCGKLKSVFSFSLAQSLVRLKELEIYECDELEQVVEELEGEEQELSPNMNLEKPLCLSKLRTLKIHGCDNLEYIFPKFMAPEGLPQLQKLDMFGLSRLKQIWRPIKEREEHGIQKLFPSLTDLTLIDCPELIDTTIHSERADLEGNIQSSKLNFISTKSLTLDKIKGDDHNLIPEMDREGLNELTVLDLRCSHSVEYLVDTTNDHVPDTAFTNLVKLTLKEMGGLKRLYNGKFPKRFLQNLEDLAVANCRELEEVFRIDEFCYSGGQNLLTGSPPCFSLQSLKVVKISMCRKLKSLFSASLIQSLQQLEELRIGFCDELKTVFTDLENDGAGTESSSHDLHLHPLCLPRLKTLYIDCFVGLEYVLPINLAQGLPRLETLILIGCTELKQIFGAAKEQDGVEHCIKLPHLSQLTLAYLRDLRSFGPENYIVKSPALKKLIISGCPQLMKCTNQEEFNNHWLHLQKILTPNVETSLGLRGREDLECLVDTTKESVPICVVFSNLVELELKNMIGLKMLCNGQPPDGFLQNLKKLTVEDCGKLQELSGGYNFMSSLKVMILGGLSWQQDLWKGSIQVVLISNLQRLEVYGCNNLTYIFSPMLFRNLRQLRTLKIWECEKVEQIIVDDDELSLSPAQDHDKQMLIFPRLEALELSDLPSLTSFSPVGYHLLFSDLNELKIKYCSQIITNFTVDSTSCVHAETKHLVDTRSLEIRYKSAITLGPLPLPPYVEEEEDEI